MSTISPSQDGPTDRNEIGISAMAQGTLAEARIVRRSETSGSGSASSASVSGADTGGGGLFLFSPGSSGADGGNRK